MKHLPLNLIRELMSRLDAGMSNRQAADWLFAAHGIRRSTTALRRMSMNPKRHLDCPPEPVTITLPKSSES